MSGEFEKAVSNSRMTVPVVKNAPDASAGSLGQSRGAGMAQNQYSSSEFSAGVSNTRSGEACPTKMYPMAPAGAYGGSSRREGGSADAQDYTPASYFNQGAAAQGTRTRSEGPDGKLGKAPNGNLPDTGSTV
jgi:hypothetical protein